MNGCISPLSDWISITHFIISRFHSQICSSFQLCFHPVYISGGKYSFMQRDFIFPFLCTTRCIRLYDSHLGQSLGVLIVPKGQLAYIDVEFFFTECISQAKTIDLIINSNACHWNCVILFETENFKPGRYNTDSSERVTLDFICTPCCNFCQI